MDITRRALLKAGALAGVGLAVPMRYSPTWGAVPAGLTKFTEQLPTLSSLGVVDLRNAGTSSTTLTMVNARHRFHNGLGLTDTFAYRNAGGTQSYLGPVIVAKQGQPATVTVSNQLGRHPLGFAIDPALVPPKTSDATKPRTATHLHGGNTDPASDGGPLDTFLPGKSYTYSYANEQEAAPLWYHDHAVGITRLNVYAGLASGYLIRNDDDPGDGNTGLPPAPDFEVPLIIQDRMFKTDGTFAYPPNPFPSTPRPWAPEFFGDVATVNGKIWPNLDVHRGKYRFRVYNGSNARTYDLKLVTSTGLTLKVWQIGTDGGLLDSPVALTRLVLGPGERADLVVDFAGLTPGTTVVLRNSGRTPYPNGSPSVQRGGAPLPEVMRFRVTGNAGWTAPLPTRLRTRAITRLSAFPVAAVRTMTLVEIMDPFGSPMMALLNNRSFMHGNEWQQVVHRSDTLERWDILNLTGDAHPIHLHFTQYQVLNRQGFDAAGYQAATYGAGMLVPDTGPYPPPPATRFLRGTPTPPPANERGWKDTVLAMPGQVTRILVPFGAGAANGEPLAIGSSYTGDYVWHCHILEHEDNDMMQQMRIG